MKTVEQGNQVATIATTTTTAANGNTGTTASAEGTVSGANQSTETKKFTQEELDEILRERLGRERSKYADYEELKGKAAKFDEINEANKTELQKATERADKLQAELDKLTKAEKVRSIRDEVAQETGVPAHLLTAETKEDCEAQANAIMSFAKPDEGYPSVKDAGEARQTSSGSTREQFEEWFNEQL